MFHHMNGVPLVIIGDRDKLFTAKYFRNFIRRLGCDLRLSSSRSQQTNGMVERKNAVIEEVIRKGINYKQDNLCVIDRGRNLHSSWAAMKL